MMQISEGIFQETNILLAAMATGALLFFVYDLLRIMRRLIPHGTLWVAVEDVLFWLGSAVVIFVMLYQQADGSLRGFSIGGVVIGMLLYAFLLSPLIVKGSVFLLEKILYVLFRPLVCLFRLLGRPFRIFGRKGSKAWLFFKKRLKKLWKTVRMCLNKQ
ncbi:MAG: spore cortex biosynthesis protein YabQ [Lachnospiraceae bacterium]|nr:spore cortex biosynthesis protein YabQ [Lachnospiraceae bacterium]MCI9151208.1 spore cortex biosynthesis protein YabQ [Lachnospiraceae bacterium]